MGRILVVCGVVLVLAAGAAGQTTSNSTIDDDADPRPGLINADSPLYGLDVALDTVWISVGVKRASSVVEERAWEALAAAEDGDTAAAEQAAVDASRFAQVAHSVNDDGSNPQRQLRDAETLLREVRDRVPAEAHDGLDTAINQVMQAQQRLPTDLPANPEISDRPSAGTPTPAARGER
ncbi:hypothetical protein [Natrinema salinisoli]|uniref:hypothetical protein n=1 Tax=Natrinema salinisoli TaxID=2878535 RepID=UPI001CF05015|nr:hypothetical protein [Natrinema salinisoli]